MLMIKSFAFAFDVSYSQKFRGKRGFPNLVNGRTSQFVSQILDRVTKCKNSEIKI